MTFVNYKSYIVQNHFSNIKIYYCFQIQVNNKTVKSPGNSLKLKSITSIVVSSLLLFWNNIKLAYGL